ncbi:MAG: hypothetical protein FWG64_02580 [Firmicutes bacterium]|nr:hypothetical protein [Bacillota bacterium]
MSTDNKIKNTTSQALIFGDNDLVYGLYTKGRLKNFRDKYGGQLLTELPSIYDVGYDNHWANYSIAMIQEWCSQGLSIHFDLTGILDMDDILANRGKYADCITSKELRFIKENLKKLANTVKFYKEEREVQPPWINE